MIKHFTKLFVVLFMAIASVMIIVDYVYNQIETQRNFERDFGQVWKSLSKQIANIEKAGDNNFQMISLSQLAWPEAQIEELKKKGFLFLELSPQESIFHGYIAETQQVLITEMNEPELVSQQWGWWFVIYGALAGVIFWWMYPNIKDIKTLQDAAIEFGKSKKLPPIKVRKKSAVFPIANALSNMTHRIHRLMSLQRDITTYAWHDIRTPLSRIRFACELIDEPGQQKLKQDIVEEISEIEELLKELLLYAEFEYTQPTMRLQQVNLQQFCQPIIDKFSAISAINIRSLVPDNCYLSIDRALFKRALLNLIGNCLRYAQQNVWISYAASDEWICVIVEDDGPGIDTDNLQYITSPFVREANQEDNNGDESNSGLGLAIVETICGWHGGLFKVGNSQEHGGARFVMQWKTAGQKKP